VGATPNAAKQSNYTVKNVEPIMSATNAQARIFTLAPGQNIPWHHHSKVTDHYFVLRGSLTIRQRGPDSECELQAGERHQIMPGTPHLLSNEGAIRRSRSSRSARQLCSARQSSTAGRRTRCASTRGPSARTGAPSCGARGSGSTRPAAARHRLMPLICSTRRRRPDRPP
jgi:quercetin dioxygenase-like cupin family protein